MGFKERIESRVRKKGVEQIRPGLFVHKTKHGYRQIRPLVWDGEWQLKNQFSWKNLIFIIIVLFVAWSYWHDTHELQNFYTTFWSDPIMFCEQIIESGLRADGTPINQINITEVFGGEEG
jgi:hypothetical protein